MLRRRMVITLGLATLVAGCWDLHPDVPEGPSPVPVARLVSVTVQYRQPLDCFNEPSLCSGRVVFFGSWMQPRAGVEAGVLLNQTPDGYVWTGTVSSVPVNFPPRDQPYLVRIFDPHLSETPTGGVTASRLQVGGQTITYFDQPGTTQESGVIYIDDDGVGHAPF